MGVVELVLAGRSGSLRDQPSEFIELRKELDAMFWSILLDSSDPTIPPQYLLSISACRPAFHETQGPLLTIVSLPKLQGRR